MRQQMIDQLGLVLLSLWPLRRPKKARSLSSRSGSDLRSLIAAYWYRRCSSRARGSSDET